MNNLVLRKEIFKILLRHPSRSETIWRRIKFNVSWQEVEDELRLLINEQSIVSRDRKFFLRDRSKANSFITEQRYVRMDGKEKRKVG